MEAKHTPGPWRVSKESPGTIERDFSAFGNDDGELIATAHGNDNSGFFPNERTGQANARLIAAAPELLEALQIVLAALQTGAPETVGYGEQSKVAFAHGWNAALEMIYARAADGRAAIAKATGSVSQVTDADIQAAREYLADVHNAEQMVNAASHIRPEVIAAMRARGLLPATGSAQ